MCEQCLVVFLFSCDVAAGEQPISEHDERFNAPVCVCVCVCPTVDEVLGLCGENTPHQFALFASCCY